MKRKLFWIIYYGITIGSIIVATILLRKHICFSWFSIYPILYLVVLSYLSFFDPCRKGCRDEHYLKIASHVFPFLIPLQAVFVLFFSSIPKALSGCMIFVAFFIIEIWHTTVLKKEAKENDKKRARELEEQKKKEKDGYIK